MKAKGVLYSTLFLALVALHGVFVPATVAQPHKQRSSRFKFSGEYGLWVQKQDGQITVHWITAARDSGFLKVFNDDSQLYGFSTPFARAHQVSFAIDQKASLTLQYGGLSNALDQHETVINLEGVGKETKSVFNKIDSIYVVGDIHGEFSNLAQLLQNAGIIDSNLNWSGRRKHLVALGDIFDRGHDVTKTLWFLYKLERQAKKQGGGVHIVLGNHEIMTFDNDLRYLSQKENLIARLHKTTYAAMYSPRTSIMGTWLAHKPGILKMNKILFAHGGVTPWYARYSIESFNDSLQTFLGEDLFQELLQDSISVQVDSVQFFRRLLFFYGEDSVFWYRGYVLADSLAHDLEQVLKRFRCKLHVVAHTSVETISEFYDGKLIAVDLTHPVTEMLLLVRRKKNQYEKYRIKLSGEIGPLTAGQETKTSVP